MVNNIINEMILTEKEILLGWKIVYSHYWLSVVHLSDNVICRDCGLITTISNWNIARCNPHIEKNEMLL